MSITIYKGMKKDSWKLVAENTIKSTQSSERAVCTWKLRGLCWENCRVWGSSVTVCRHRGFDSECSGDAKLNKQHRNKCSALGAPMCLAGVGNDLPDIFICSAMGLFGVFHCFLYGEIKSTRKAVYHLTPFSRLQRRRYFPFICPTGAAPFFRRRPAHSRLRIPPLFCRRNSL